MIRKTAIGLLTFIVMVLITMVFGSCKARKSTVSIVDTTGITKSNTQLKTQEKQIDQTKVKEVVSVTKTDSTTTTTTITPADGEVINVKPDGTFTGKAKKVETKTTKKSDKKVDKETTTAKNISTEIKKDSTGKFEQKSTVHKKDKEVEAKANNAWMIYAGIAILIIFVGIYVVKKFF